MRARSFLRRHWRFALFVALVTTALVLYNTSDLKRHLSPQALAPLRDTVLSLGWKGIALFLVSYVFIITFGLPNLPFQLAAGAIYGVWTAFAMMYVGVNLGALSAFFFARGLGRRALEELFHERLKMWNEQLLKIKSERKFASGFRYILILRLIPLMPFNTINYAAGMSRIRLKDYFWATILGTLPLTYVHVVFGSAIGEYNLLELESWKSPKVYLPVSFAVIALIAGVITLKRTARNPSPADDTLEEKVHLSPPQN